jgi:hypothetical protein
MLVSGNEVETCNSQSHSRSGFFIALISTQSGSRRGFANTELSQALEILKEFPEGQIFIVPVRLDNCKLTQVATKGS